MPDKRMGDQEFSYIIKRLEQTYADHQHYQKLYEGQTGRHWVPEIRLSWPKQLKRTFPDTGIRTHLQRDLEE